MIAILLFWLCVAAVFHSYILFPLLLRLLGLMKSKPPVIHPAPDAPPLVSILMSAYNEEEVIAEKVRSVFSSRYPAERFGILVGSDGSTDRTPEILRELEKEFPTLKPFIFTERQGKPNVINLLAAKAPGSILVFTDANVLFDENTLPEMMAPFADPRMGLVDTRMVNLGMKKEGISFQEKAYISREVGIKDLESRLWGTMMGPFGGCFAIRAELFEPIPRNFLVDDFFLNMKVLESGYKAVNNPRACVYEDVSNDAAIEFRRKIRIATGNFQNLARFRNLLFSRRPGLSFCFWSHKVLRWIGPLFILGALFSLIIIAFTHPPYRILLIINVVVLLVPGLDFALKKLNLHFPFFRFISHFLAMNLAMAKGLLRYLKGVKTNVWQPTKRHQ
jgi:cellulose synthase/poly-beta-1,6-N-acetylglucosamine synthase-like glycosyltransferase